MKVKISNRVMDFDGTGMEILTDFDENLLAVFIDGNFRREESPTVTLQDSLEATIEAA